MLDFMLHFIKQKTNIHYGLDYDFLNKIHGDRFLNYSKVFKGQPSGISPYATANVRLDGCGTHPKACTW